MRSARDRLIRRFLVLAALVPCIAGLAACTPPEPEPPTRPDLSAAIVQLRSDFGLDRVQIRVGNESDSDAHVQTVVLDSNRLSAAVTWTKGTVVPPGAQRDLRVDLPPMRCGSGPMRAVVAILVATERGDEVVRVEPDDPFGHFKSLVDSTCFEQAVFDLARVRFTGVDHAGGDEPAELVLRVSSRGGSAVTIESVESTVLLSALDADGEPAESRELAVVVDDESPDVDVRIPLVPSRCDPHALAEDKRGTVFEFTVNAAGSTGVVAISAPDPVRAELYRFFTEYCEVGG